MSLTFNKKVSVNNLVIINYSLHYLLQKAICW